MVALYLQVSTVCKLCLIRDEVCHPIHLERENGRQNLSENDVQRTLHGLQKMEILNFLAGVATELFKIAKQVKMRAIKIKYTHGKDWAALTWTGTRQWTQSGKD